MTEQLEPSQSLVSTPKKRSQADKKGIRRYTLELVHEILDRLDIIETTLCYIVDGLQSAEYVRFEQSYIEKVCRPDDIDKAILEQLWLAGHRGMLPKDIIRNIKDPKLWDRKQIQHRIKRMNKRLYRRIKKEVAEKTGHEWTLTDFAYQAYKLTKEELKEEFALTGISPEGSKEKEEILENGEEIQGKPID